jgi:hypothetical protein
MKSIKRPLGNNMLYSRIDAMQMSTADRELAKARLRGAEVFADALCATIAAIRSSAAFVARQVRTTFTPSAQH